MDEFAQTRELDNLFEDDFTPIVTEPKTQTKAPQSHQSQRGQHKQPPSVPKPAANANESEETPTTSTLDQTSRPPAAVRGDRSATGGINKPKLTEIELSARLEAAKLNNARREEAHRLAEADEASFQKREAQASRKRIEEGSAKIAMEGEREKNRLRKLGAQAGREWDEGKKDQQGDARKGSQYRRGAHGGVAYSGGRQQDGYGEYASRDQDYAGLENFGQRGGRGRGDRSRGERGRGGRGGRGRGGGYEGGRASQNDSSSNWETTAPSMGAETDFPSLPTTGAKPRSPKYGWQPNGTDADPASPSPVDAETQNWADRIVPPLGSPTVAETQSWADQLVPTPLSPIGAKKQSWADQMAGDGVKW